MNDAGFERLLVAAIRDHMQRTNPIHEIDDGHIVMNIVTVEAPAVVVLPSIFLRRQAT